MYGLVVAAERHLAAPTTSDSPDITIIEHAERRPSAAPVNPRGYSYAVLPDKSVHVSWSKLFDFVVNPAGDRIDVYAGHEPRVDTAYTYLISQVISVALLQRGVETLHASAVAFDDRGIVLVGDSGYGKSTLTAALLERGARLVTDDLLVIEKREDTFFIVPGATRIKLHPDTAHALGWKLSGVPMNDGSGKYVYILPAENTVAEPLPLRRILLLHPHAESVAMRPAGTTETVHAVLAATFNPLHTEPVRLEKLLRNARSIAACNCAYLLDVPRDLTKIGDVVQAALA